MSVESALARTLARNVRLLMAVRGIRRQNELAELLHMTEQRLSTKLHGREVWTLTDIQRLAEALDTTGAALLAEDLVAVRAESGVSS
jgi:transcriptional regulator with XRE-family HTH domain